MSKMLKQVIITPARSGDEAGYQATVELQDGERATSVIFGSTDEANAWATTYAENAESGTDQPKSAEVNETTTATVDPPAGETA